MNAVLSALPDTTPYQRLAKLGLTLPELPRPIGNFATHIQEGGLIYLSGQGRRMRMAGSIPARSAATSASQRPMSMPA